MKFLTVSLLCFATALPPVVLAQVFETPGAAPAPAPAPAPSSSPPAAAPRPVMGNDLPFLDPGSEVAQWDGHSWSITNNRIFRARLEKYLAAPEENSAQDAAYRKVILETMQALSPMQKGGPNLVNALTGLKAAAEFPIDARLCDSLAQAVYSVTLYRKNSRMLAAANKMLEKDRHDQGWKMEMANSSDQMRRERDSRKGDKNKDGGAVATSETDTAMLTRTGSYLQRIVEIDAARVTNAAKMGTAELKAKMEFQAIIVQFFLQRRFEHCIIAGRLYRVLFEDGAGELNLKEGSDAHTVLTKTTGTTPTVSALDALSSEAIRDVDEGVKAFVYLADQGDLESASKRLSEAFIIGEYLPRLRTLERARKQKVLRFVRDSNQLISAIEVKDYTLAEEMVEKLRKTAKDFDYSKPRAAIETARSASALHIQNARSAAIRKDEKAVADNIEKAALIWPTNPDLRAFSTQVATYGDMNSRILNDLDTLIAQKNFREIYREQIKYAGAVLGKPEYEEKLKAVIGKVAQVEKVVITADEMVKAGDRAGAWERLEEISADFPDDNEVNRRRAGLAPHNADFINAVTQARRHEENLHRGISLSWYLRARRLYPASILAKQGLQRLADQILPETSSSASSAPAGAVSSASENNGSSLFDTPPSSATAQ